MVGRTSRLMPSNFGLSAFPTFTEALLPLTTECQEEINKPGVLPCLSEEQLNALLEECVQTPRVNNLALQRSQGSFLERASPCCDTAVDTITVEDAQSVKILANQEIVEAEYKDMSAKEMMETSACSLNEALVESHPSEKKENYNQDDEEEMAHITNSDNYFMSIALSTERPKKPSFLDEPFYCISLNNEPSTDVDIPGITLKTRGEKLKDEDVNEE